MTDGCDISNEIVLRWTSPDLSDDKSTLVQVMAWCRQAPSHYLKQCWPTSLPLYGVTRPQWVNSLAIKQTPQKLFMLYWTKRVCLTTFLNFTHDYINKFYWSSYIFHWSFNFFISRGLRTDKFGRVWLSALTPFNPQYKSKSDFHTDDMIRYTYI